MAADERFTRRDEDGPRRRGPRGPVSEVIDGPVRDWATDFSHVDPAWAADPYAIQDDLRERCPVARTERFGGAWLPTRYEDVAAAAYDTERFTSRGVVVTNFRPSADLAPAGISPPITSDPPFHHEARKLLLPPFAKKSIARYEEPARAFCHELIDGLDGRSSVDAAREYAQHIPVRVIADMLGFPPEDGPRFAGFVHDTAEAVNLPPDERIARTRAVGDYLLEQVRDHVDNPRDDLTTYLINAELHGEKLSARHLVGGIAVLLIAGIDTTWSAIGASLWHLARNADDRKRLAGDPSLIPAAIEEFLRAYAPVSMARLVKEDTHWRGVQMKADDWVLLSFPAANRDPAQFEDAGEVIIDREVNRHAAFGLGIHRCIGSHLARMELRVALETWLERVPSFRLDPSGETTWSAGQVRGPRTLPLLIGSS